MWKIVKLGDMLEVQNGYAFNSKQFDVDGDMPLIRIRDLKNAFNTKTFYTGEYDDRYIVQSGDLLIGMDGEFRCYEWQGVAALLNQRVCRLQNFHADLNKRFLLYAINSELKKIEDVTGFTTVKHLSSKTIKQIELSIPPLEEQQRIVAKLDAAFTEINESLIDTEKAIQAAENVLINLVDDKTKNKIEWNEYKVSDLGSVQTGNTPKTSNKENYGLDMPFVKPANFQSDGKIIPADEGLSSLGASQSRIADKNSIMMVCIGATIGKVGICSEDVCFNQQINALTPRDEFDAELIYWQMRGSRFQSEIRRKAGQATLPIISKSKWENLSIFLPDSLTEQVIIRKLLRDLYSQTEGYINHKQLKRRELSALKSAILQHELKQSVAA